MARTLDELYENGIKRRKAASQDAGAPQDEEAFRMAAANLRDPLYDIYMRGKNRATSNAAQTGAMITAPQDQEAFRMAAANLRDPLYDIYMRGKNRATSNAAQTAAMITTPQDEEAFRMAAANLRDPLYDIYMRGKSKAASNAAQTGAMITAPQDEEAFRMAAAYLRDPLYDIYMRGKSKAASNAAQTAAMITAPQDEEAFRMAAAYLRDPLYDIYMRGKSKATSNAAQPKDPFEEGMDGEDGGTVAKAGKGQGQTAGTGRQGGGGSSRGGGAGRGGTEEAGQPKDPFEEGMDGEDGGTVEDDSGVDYGEILPGEGPDQEEAGEQAAPVDISPFLQKAMINDAVELERIVPLIETYKDAAPMFEEDVRALEAQRDKILAKYFVMPDSQKGKLPNIIQEQLGAMGVIAKDAAELERIVPLIGIYDGMDIGLFDEDTKELKDQRDQILLKYSLMPDSQRAKLPDIIRQQLDAAGGLGYIGGEGKWSSDLAVLMGGTPVGPGQQDVSDFDLIAIAEAILSKAEGRSVQLDGKLDEVQFALDVIGSIPGLGEGADALNALISLGRGNDQDAMLSLASIIPLADIFTKSAKLARYLPDGVSMGKYIIKSMDEAVEVGEAVVRNADEIIDAGGTVVRNTDEAAKVLGNIDEVVNEAETAGKYIDNTKDTLTKGEKQVVDELVGKGKTVERIAKDPKAIDKTPDFIVDHHVYTELKTLNNPNTGTGMKRVQEGFEQHADTVIINARGTGLSPKQAEEIINRARGKYPNRQLPGKVEIWIDGQIITYP